MQELLSNTAVQAAIAGVIVVLLNTFVAYIKTKFPTQAALVEKNWCYLQPAVEAAIAKAEALVKENGKLTAVSSVSSIVANGVLQFMDQYAKLEGTAASTAEVAAARAEIVEAVNKIVG